MQIISWQELKTQFRAECLSAKRGTAKYGSALSCGVFDGVHRGHKALIRAITTQRNLHSVVVTFRENPRRILRPGHNVCDIITLEKKIERLESLGVETLVLVDFSNEFRTLSGEEFIQTLIDKACMRLFVIGTDFKCGAGGAFGSGEIVSFCKKNGVETLIVEPVIDGGAPVSSSRIRAALRNGDEKTALRLLG